MTAYAAPGVTYPMRKVALGSIDEYVPLVGIIANGGMTTTLADIGWQRDEIARMLADGHRIVREWWVAECAEGCSRLFTVDSPDEVPICGHCASDFNIETRDDACNYQDEACGDH